jgi:hypothetical protein
MAAPAAVFVAVRPCRPRLRPWFGVLAAVAVVPCKPKQVEGAAGAVCNCFPPNKIGGKYLLAPSVGSGRLGRGMVALCAGFEQPLCQVCARFVRALSGV